jgi:hypothetical protein
VGTIISPLKRIEHRKSKAKSSGTNLKKKPLFIISLGAADSGFLTMTVAAPSTQQTRDEQRQIHQKGRVSTKGKKET